MMKPIFIILLSLFIFEHTKAQTKTIVLPAEDGVMITVDLYTINSKDAPTIILYHQAKFSRGEYREIAPKLNTLGFNCIAIDQRAGKEVNNVINETHKSALTLNKETNYIDALPDVISILNYVKSELRSPKIIIWGSSYSASLSLYLGSQYPNDIDGIVSFSPGEYFKINGKEIGSYTSKIICPVFITSAKNEEKNWTKMYQNINSEKVSFLPSQEGTHGSKALWMDSKENNDYWMAVRSFLKRFQNEK